MRIELHFDTQVPSVHTETFVLYVKCSCELINVCAAFDVVKRQNC